MHRANRGLTAIAKQFLNRLISFSILAAGAGVAVSQEPSCDPPGFKELFQPDSSVSSAGEKRLVLVNTATNRLFVTSGEKVIFQASCSTGKGTAMTVGDERHSFVTPKGDFLIQSKEERPAWVPPDWYFIEEARKRGLRILRLQPGRPISLGSDAGLFLASNGGASSGQRLEVRGDRVVLVSGPTVRELPPGRLIQAGDAIVIPPYGTLQRKFSKVLGACRINFGGGFGIHGTDQPDKIGRSVTHGCVRLSDADIRALYALVEVGDEVVIF